MKMNNKIRLFINNTGIETTLSKAAVLLDLLRKDLKGTKEVCREGDCGACTVLLGEKINGKLVYRTVASCITPVGSAAGRHIVTIEGLNREEGLSPIQDEFLNMGASQCGFCTPGFIVSLTGFFINSSSLSYWDALDAMDGNICRCTGYMSIKRAAGNLSDKYGKMLDKNEDRIKQLVKWKILPGYFNFISDKLEETVSSEIKRKKGKTLVAGGTDLFVQKPANLLEEEIDFAGKDKNLAIIKEQEGEITIGCNTTVTDLTESSVIRKYFPGFKKIKELISSTIIRNRATVSGNIVNASPIGDISVILLSLNAVLKTAGSKNSRNILLKDFYSGYKVLDLENNEYIREISFNAPGENTKFNFEKVSKRKHLDIASVNTAVLMKMEKKRIDNICISAGGVWPYPLFMSKTSGFLSGKELTPGILKQAAKVLLSEISPIDDIRGSAEYKALLLRQLIYAHFITLYPEYIKTGDLL